jgi:zinc protease
LIRRIATVPPRSAARVLDRGTVTRSADAIADDLDGRGASLSVAAGRHQMAVAATCLTEDFAAVLALAADVARHPRFADEEIETRRDNLITSIRQEETTRQRWRRMRLRRLLRHASVRAKGARDDGWRHGDSTQDLVRFHQKGYDPPAISVIVVGDVEEEAAIAAVSKVFGDWSPSAEATGDKPL